MLPGTLAAGLLVAGASMLCLLPSMEQWAVTRVGLRGPAAAAAATSV